MSDRATQLAELSRHPHVLRKVDFAAGYGADRPAAADIDDANVFTSALVDQPGHTIALDLDVPARLVPSTTPGHSHLYIDKPITWPEYMRLLDVLDKCGVLESGYVAASIERGYTALRLPWIKKGDTV